MEKADYDKTHKDYSESVDALQRAIAVLKKQAYDREQKSSLAQVSALTSMELIPADAKKTIDLFLAQGMEDALELAPEANAYEFQSSGIIEMLEKLLDKFVDQRTDLQKEEMNSKHAYELLVQDLDAQIGEATKSRTEKSEVKAAKLEAKAVATSDKKDTTATMTEDKKMKSTTAATCSQKASDFESRQQLRAEEIVAIEKAIEILSSSEVKGAAEAYLPSLVQKKSALAQLRAGSPQSQLRMSKFLQGKAEQLNSRVLATLATRAAADPFVKVKKMIKDLLVRLMEEANEEADHKSWCDTELASNAATRKEKTEAVEMLTAEIDGLKAAIAKLSEDITTLEGEVAYLVEAMAKETGIRADEKATNEATIKDAQEAQTAVAQALTVLKEFYEKAGQATSLAQQPEIFDSPYKGLQGESGGVIGMLEVIESDFARLEAETKASEATAQKTYDQFMTDSKEDKASKETTIEHKTAKKQDQNQAKTVTEKDLDGTQKELDAALDYYDKLKPSCITVGVSYDDRVSRRKEEIASLQEALRILEGESI
mmetsp:Transcript_39419/g.73199  ORF Transcript_39419/g.73199 Transcript_39419/m.73199 type:complete len:543 (+) Transcript_39419:2-1630(+)